MALPWEWVLLYPGEEGRMGGREVVEEFGRVTLLALRAERSPTVLDLEVIPGTEGEVEE